MNKIFLLILIPFPSYLAQAQKAVVALPAMNIVYIGLENPVQIAKEGYSNDQLTVTGENCSIVHLNSQNYVVKVSMTGTCKVIVSYKEKKSLKTDTIEFRIKSVPKPEPLFGDLESGSHGKNRLLNQNTINASLGNFYFKGVDFTVRKASILYVPKMGEAIALNQNGNQIPFELKRLIAIANSGDKILVDGIEAVGPGGISRKLGPIAITIAGSGHYHTKTDMPNYYICQPNKNLKQDTLYNPENYEYPDEKEILVFKGYKVECGIAKLFSEIKRNSKKVLWEKHFYTSGRLKAEYNFEGNDTTGTARRFYENGLLKSEGKLLAKTVLISEGYLEQFTYAGVLLTNTSLLDSFLFDSYSPIGEWKGYYENGKAALECTLAVYNYGIIPKKDGDPEIYPYSDSDPGKKMASIKEASLHREIFFKTSFTGSFKLYDREGKILKEQNFKE